MKKSRLTYYVNITIVISILSQIKEAEFLARPIMHILWIGLVLIGIIKNNATLKLSRFTITYTSLYAVYIVVCLTVSAFGLNHLSSLYLRALAIPMLVLLASNCNHDFFTTSSFISFSKTYVISAVLFAIYVNINYFVSYSAWITQLEYVYSQKNSASQIWGTGLILSFYVFSNSKNKRKRIWLISACYLLLIICLCRCRTALLSLILGGIISIFYSTKRKFEVSIAFAISLALIIGTPFFLEFVKQAFFLSKYVGANLDAFSAGRLNLYRIAILDFYEHILFGTGNYYVDSSYIMILTESGIVGFILIETIWLNRISLNIKTVRISSVKSEKLCLLYMTLFYIGESFLEGFPPFGPGVSSFFFWIFSEIMPLRESRQLTYGGSIYGSENLP